MKNIYLLLLFFTLSTIDSYSQSSSKNEITEWINKNLVPIKYVTAEHGFEDLKSLDKLIGNATIVELGECTHGSSEIFTMKHRMLEYLVKEKGFTIFSIEANMPEAYALNKYILYGQGDPKKLLAGMYFWTWDTQEVLDMIEWMRKYNINAKTKVIFTGFDMQIPLVSIKIVRDFVNVHLQSLVSEVNEYDTLYNQNIRKNGFKNVKEPSMISLAKNILDELQRLNSIKNDTNYTWALQNSRLLLQYANMLNGKETRDESMAENVKWISDQNPNEKIVIWAHNGHVRKAQKYEKVMGYYLNKKFEDQMITIGFSTEEGTYTAVKRMKGQFALLDSGNNLLPSTEKAIEYYFKTAQAENFIVDFRQAKKDEQLNKWISKKIEMRDIGARVNDKYQFFDTHLGEDFDMIIFLKRTTSSKCFSIIKK